MSNNTYSTQVETEYRKVVGLPGTGKTTFLLNEFQTLLKNGVPANKIAFLGFTRAACDEAIQRGAKFCPELSEGKRLWIRTIHATCFYLGITKGLFLGKKVVDYHATKTFCDQVGLEAPKVDDDNAEGGDVSTGTAFFSTLAYLVNTFTPLERFEECPHSDALKGLDFKGIAEAWVKFKKEKSMIDFNDMLAKVYYCTNSQGEHLNIPCEYMFADEFQDNSPLQTAIIKMFAKGKKIVWVAGDANQAIYEFQGADPKLFLNFNVNNTHILPRSYRCPEEIWRVAQTLIKDNVHRIDTDGVQSNGPGGVYKLMDCDARYFHEIVDEIDPASTYILLRTNYLAKNISWKLAENGIPFKYIDGEKEKVFGWTKKKVKILNDALLATTDEWKRRKLIEQAGKAEDMSQFAVKFLQYYSGLKKPLEPKEITLKLGTIHSAKGREAKTVILFDSITGRVMDGMLTEAGMESERRCFYVGATRAKEKLCVIHDYFGWLREKGQRIGFFQFPEEV